MTIGATAELGPRDSCRGLELSYCPGPPASLPDPHRSQLLPGDHDGWEHLDVCGGCRIVIWGCSTREKVPCGAAARSFEDQAAQVTERAQRLWAKKQRDAGNPVAREVLRDTTSDLFVVALRRLHGYTYEQIRSEKARFSTFWLGFLPRDAGDLYVRSLKQIKPEAELTEEEPDTDLLAVSRIPKSLSEVELEQALSLMVMLRKWFQGQAPEDRKLLAALVGHYSISAKSLSNAALYEGLYGPDGPGRAGMHNVRRRLQQIRAKVNLPLSDVDPRVRPVLAHLVVRAARRVPDLPFADPDQLLVSVDLAVAELRETLRRSRDDQDEAGDV